LVDSLKSIITEERVEFTVVTKDVVAIAEYSEQGMKISVCKFISALIWI